MSHISQTGIYGMKEEKNEDELAADLEEMKRINYKSGTWAIWMNVRN